MYREAISSFISRTIAISLLLLMPVFMQAQSKKEILPLAEDTIPLFRGFSVSWDLVGLVQMAFGSYGQYEGALRINLKDKYFPVVELGYGKANAEDDATHLTYRTNAPYGRIGCDFNFMKNKRDINRLYGGVRYAFTSYKFDVLSPGVKDPYWGNLCEYGAQGVKAYYHWLEFVVGVDAKVWRNFRMGWSARYKRRLFHDDGNMGETWYVPGYGKQGNLRLGGTFNLTLEF
ncbi:MAG: hypothetical protein IJK87_15895 [Prevotella sp.]|nr:hypothetical protein [Prevotella sp.]